MISYQAENINSLHSDVFCNQYWLGLICTRRQTMFGIYANIETPPIAFFRGYYLLYTKINLRRILTSFRIIPNEYKKDSNKSGPAWNPVFSVSWIMCQTPCLSMIYSGVFSRMKYILRGRKELRLNFILKGVIS